MQRRTAQRDGGLVGEEADQRQLALEEQAPLETMVQHDRARGAGRTAGPGNGDRKDRAQLQVGDGVTASEALVDVGVGDEHGLPLEARLALDGVADASRSLLHVFAPHVAGRHDRGLDLGRALAPLGRVRVHQEEAALGAGELDEAVEQQLEDALRPPVVDERAHHRLQQLGRVHFGRAREHVGKSVARRLGREALRRLAQAGFAQPVVDAACQAADAVEQVLGGLRSAVDQLDAAQPQAVAVGQASLLHGAPVDVGAVAALEVHDLPRATARGLETAVSRRERAVVEAQVGLGVTPDQRRVPAQLMPLRPRRRLEDEEGTIAIGHQRIRSSRAWRSRSCRRPWPTKSTVTRVSSPRPPTSKSTPSPK